MPALYYLFRMVQKRLSIRKNRKNELNRVIKHKTEDLEKRKAAIDTFMNEESDNFPEGFKEEIIEFSQKEISMNEKMIDKIKEKL